MLVHRVAAVAAVLALSCSSDEPPTVRTRYVPPLRQVTAAELTSGKLAKDTPVSVELVMLPETLLVTKGDGERRFVFGVAPGSRYVTRLTELATAAEELLPKVRAMAKTSSEEEIQATSQAVEALATRINDATSAIAEAAIVDIGTETPIDVELETVYESFLGDPRKLRVTGFQKSMTSVEEVNKALAVLEAEDPPNPASPMPTLFMLTPSVLATEDEVRPYNKMVARFNRELARRRPIVARQAALDLEQTAISLRRMAARPPQRLVVTPVEPVDIAERSLGKSQQQRVYVTERREGAGWAAGYFTRASLVVLSDPPGAEVWIDGARAGETPHTMEDLPIGKAMQLKLVRAGSKTVEKPVTVTAVPNRLIVVTELLRPAK
jgi:hypothetical protein